MEINQGGIRNLFRYVSFSLYSLMVIFYAVFSFLTLIFWNGEIDKIENNSLSKLIVKNSGKEIDVKNNDQSGSKWIFSPEKDEIVKVQPSKSRDFKRIVMNTNQFLQNGKFQKGTIEENVNNPFDIEKIIADLQLQKEKRVAVVAKELGIDWKNEKLKYAKLAGIDGNYNGSLEQNMKIRDYLIYNAQEIYKEEHGWNEWDTLPLVAKTPKEVKLNSKEITGQVTYNDVTLKVTAPVESFPEGSVLKIKTLGDNDSITTFDITLKEVTLLTQVDNVELDAPMASFDISFYAPDDTEFLEELQPAEGKYVSVVFDYTNNDDFKKPEDDGFLAIYHMEDTDYTSFANLVSIKDSETTKENTKSDSIGIYANSLSVYILTIVSDLNEDGDNIVMFDASTGGFITENENIILSSTGTTDDIITGKILSTEDTIILPDIQLSGYNFGGWYSNNTFLGNAGDIFKLGNSDNSNDEEKSDLIPTNNYTLYACAYVEGFSGDLCNFDGKQDFAPNYEGVIEESVDDEMQEVNDDTYTPTKEEVQKYGQETFDAYNRAIDKGITNIDDINKARLNTNITRAELAKMMVVFMSGVLEKEPNIIGSTVYKDVNKKKLGDLADYIQLAYQYQIMGINTDGTPMENFNPNKPVSRGEFATVLSRVLYGERYNNNGGKYYEKHIEALNKANILNDTNPNITEWRGWIITMLYRATL